jgi:undecaprenyl-diphosphatase
MEYMDEEVSKFFLNKMHGIPFINYFMKYVSSGVIITGIWTLIFSSILIYRMLKYKQISLSIFYGIFLFGLAILLSEMVIKPIINRPRPYIVMDGFKEFMDSINLKYPKNTSFPSSHSLTNAFLGLLALSYNKKFGFFTIPYLILTMISRIFLGAHYLTDTLTGASLGIIFYIIFIYTKKYIINIFGRKISYEIC